MLIFPLRHIAFFLFLVILFADATAQFLVKGNPYVLNFYPTDYHSNPNNFSIIQSKSGLVYVGNLWGVIEFDGYSWRKIYIPNASSCVSLAEDDKGTIFIGGRSEFGYLKPDSLGILRYESLLPLVPVGERNFSDIWRTHSLNNRIIFAAFEKIFIYDYKNISIISSVARFDFAHKCNNTIYIKQSDKGLYTLSNDSLILTPNGHIFNNISVTGMLATGNNQFIISGIEEGLGIYDYSTYKQFQKKYISSLIKDQAWRLNRTSNGMYSIGTRLNGIYFLDQTLEFAGHINKSNGLGGNSINDIYACDNNDLWIALNNSLSYIKPKHCFQFIKENMGVQGLPYSSYINNTHIYLGTSEGLYYYKRGSSETGFNPVTGCSGQIWKIENINGNILCGQVDGIYLLNNHAATKIANVSAWAFIPFKGSSKLVAGGYNGIFTLEKTGTKWIYKNIKGFSAPSRFLCQDNIGDIWVSDGNKGVFRIRLNLALDSAVNIKLYNSSSGLPSDFDNTLYKINNEILITTKNSVYRFNQNTEKIEPHPAWKYINAAKLHVERIAEADKENLYIIYNLGNIGYLTKDKKGNYILSESIGKFTEKLIGSFEHLRHFGNKNFILGTIEGFVIYTDSLNSEKHIKNNKWFNAYVRQVELTSPSLRLIWGGHNKPILNEYIPVVNSIVKHYHNSILFTFASNNYEDISSTLYSSALSYNGSNPVWSEWANANKKEFNNLPHGHYIFSIKAKDTYGHVSNTDSFSFIILPPWYQTIWAYLALLLLLMTALYLIYIYIKFRFKEQMKRLELEEKRKLLVQQRQHDEEILRNEKEIIQLQNEKLKAELEAIEQHELLRKQEEEMKEKQFRAEKEILHLKSEKLEAEMIFKNNELAAIAVQMAHKNDILIQLRNKIEKEIKAAKEIPAKNALRQIDEMIVSELNFDDNWELFKKHFDNVHNDFIKRLTEKHPNLKLHSLQLCSYLRMQLSNKQIAALMNTSESTIAKSRFRLREKLNLKEGDKVIDYLKQF